MKFGLKANKVLLSGDTFNANGNSTLVKLDGNRCSLNFFYLADSEEGSFCVKLGKDKYAFIDSNFNLLRNKIYKRDFYNRFAYDNGKLVYIDKTGREIAINPEYRETDKFHEGLSRIKGANNLYGFIDKSGGEIIAPQYRKAKAFSNSMAFLCKEKWGAIDKNGNMIIPFIFDEIKPIWVDYEQIRDVFKVHYGGWENGHYGLINRNGEWLAKAEFDVIEYGFKDGLFVFREYMDEELREVYHVQNLFGVYDIKQQKVLFKLQFDDIDFLNKGYILASTRKKIDYENSQYIKKLFNREGKEILLPGGYEILDYYETADKKKKYYEIGDYMAKGLLNADTNEFIFTPEDKCIHFFIEEEHAAFIKHKKIGLCDFKRNIIIKPEYDNIRGLLLDEKKNFTPKFYEVSTGIGGNQKSGIFKKDGTILVPVEYQSISFCYDKQHILCKKDGIWSLLKIETV